MTMRQAISEDLVRRTRDTLVEMTAMMIRIGHFDDPTVFKATGITQELYDVIGDNRTAERA